MDLERIFKTVGDRGACQRSLPVQKLLIVKHYREDLVKLLNPIKVGDFFELGIISS